MQSQRHNFQHLQCRPRDVYAEPRPPMPTRLPPRTDRGQVLIELDGHTYGSRILQPGYSGGRSARSDQIAVQIDGQWRTMSLRAAVLAFESQVPRELTLRELARMEW